MVRFRLTLISPTEEGVHEFTADGDIWTETDAAKTLASRFTTDPSRASVMKIKGITWDLGDGYTLGDGLYLDDSPLGVDEGAYYDFVVTPESLYSFSCLYKIELGTLDLIFWDQTNDAEIDTLVLDDIGSWLGYECNLTAPIGCVLIRVTFSQHDIHSGPYYIDNVSLSNNMILSDPDVYNRTPQRAGSFHKTINGNRVYDLNEVHYSFVLVWNFCDWVQYANFVSLLFSDELIYFDDGDVPPITENFTLAEADSSEVINLGYRALLDAVTNDVISVKNLTTGTVLTLTTHYTIATDRRSLTILGQTLGDIIRVRYNRYFEVMLLDMREDWLGGDRNVGITRKVIMSLETLAIDG